MESQIFKNKIPIELLFTLFNLVITIQSNDQSKYYIIDKTIFKKLQYNNYIQEFLDEIIQYYYTSKQYYVTRNINYNNFLTIVRQICKINNINITKKILYTKSNYNILYYIYI